MLFDQPQCCLTNHHNFIVSKSFLNNDCDSSPLLLQILYFFLVSILQPGQSESMANTNADFIRPLVFRDERRIPNNSLPLPSRPILNMITRAPREVDEPAVTGNISCPADDSFAIIEDDDGDVDDSFISNNSLYVAPGPVEPQVVSSVSQVVSSVSQVVSSVSSIAPPSGTEPVGQLEDIEEEQELDWLYGGEDDDEEVNMSTSFSSSSNYEVETSAPVVASVEPPLAVPSTAIRTAATIVGTPVVAVDIEPDIELLFSEMSPIAGTLSPTFGEPSPSFGGGGGGPPFGGGGGGPPFGGGGPSFGGGGGGPPFGGGGGGPPFGGGGGGGGGPPFGGGGPPFGGGATEGETGTRFYQSTDRMDEATGFINQSGFVNQSSIFLTNQLLGPDATTVCRQLIIEGRYIKSYFPLFLFLSSSLSSNSSRSLIHKSLLYSSLSSLFNKN
jgi:hypothetical protein